jgi:hypothetical protein
MFFERNTALALGNPFVSPGATAMLSLVPGRMLLLGTGRVRRDGRSKATDSGFVSTFTQVAYM